MSRRRPFEMEADRNHLLAYVGREWVRPEPWMRQGDLDALVAAGTLERQVRTEWEHQRNASHLFGGAGVSRRRRAYYRRNQGASS